MDITYIDIHIFMLYIIFRVLTIYMFFLVRDLFNGVIKNLIWGYIIFTSKYC